MICITGALVLLMIALIISKNERRKINMFEIKNYRELELLDKINNLPFVGDYFCFNWEVI